MLNKFVRKPPWHDIIRARAAFFVILRKYYLHAASMKLLIAILFTVLIIASCKVNEKMIPGHYFSKNTADIQFVFNENETFEMKLELSPGFYSGGEPDQTTGVWKLENTRLKLLQPQIPLIDDSITRFTNISCLNFWNKNGDPVSIRYILVPPEKLKPHFGNSLYFFSQDFKPTDTLTFYFEGYPPFKFPGSVPSAIGNNMHKITMKEPNGNRPREMEFIVRKKGLVLLPQRIRYTKKG